MKLTFTAIAVLTLACLAGCAGTEDAMKRVNYTVVTPYGTIMGGGDTTTTLVVDTRAFFPPPPTTYGAPVQLEK